MIHGTQAKRAAALIAALSAILFSPTSTGQQAAGPANRPALTATEQTALEAAETAIEAHDGHAAVALLEPLALAGSAAAQTRLGDIFFEGLGLGRDHETALEWYRMGAANGDTTRLERIGHMYALGQGTAEDPGEAENFWRQALAAYEERLADPGIRRAASLMYARGWGTSVDGVKAVSLLEPLITAGDRAAQTQLADFYYWGYGVSQDDEQALRWYLAAAGLGDTRRLERIGRMLAEGRGTPPDPMLAQAYWNRALDVYLRRAERDPANLISAALMIARGQGAPADGRRAVGLLEPLAHANNVRAQVAIGDIYFGGLGLEPDRGAALRWYSLAATNGDDSRTERIEELRR